jgi:Phosphotransferase enzyme family
LGPSFFAAAWNNRPTVEQSLGLLDEYYDILDQVSQGLPEQLQAKLGEVRQELPLLFRPDYPMAFQHDDLLENNIHVDETTGHITGIVDWSDGIIAPFGVSLIGLETLLGVQTMTKWHFHPNHLSLRKHFWRTFFLEVGSISEKDHHSIEVARLFGLFRTHGFEEKDQAIVYLEALCFL